MQSPELFLKGEDLSSVDVNLGKIMHRSHGEGEAVLIWQSVAKPPQVPQQFDLKIKRENSSDEDYWKKLLSTQSGAVKMLRVGAGYAETQ
jgi:hypothetical protein